jgi:anti-anti-sigma factor
MPKSINASSSDGYRTVMTSQDGGVRVRPEGELDLASAPELAHALSQALDAGQRVLLDLSRITFIDSSGLNAILVAVRDSGAAPGSLRVSPVLPSQVRRVFELAGVASLLPLAGD